MGKVVTWSRLLVLLCVVVVADEAHQGYKLYQQHSKAPPPVVRTAPSGTMLDLRGHPIEGDPQAKIVLVEFSDFECPFCIRHATQVHGELRKRFVDTGKLRYAFINNPLPIHSHALVMATAAMCAADQSRFWQMHELLFTEQPLTKRQIVLSLQGLDINASAIQRCLDQSEPAGQIEQDIKQAQQLGLVSTPSFALGVLNSSGLEVHTFIRGAQPIDVFEKAILALSQTAGIS